MRNNIYCSIFAIIICLSFKSLYAQTTNSMPPPNLRDRWDTLHASVHYSNTSTYLFQVDSKVFGNKLALISDSIGVSTSASHFQIFNSVGNTITNINYNRFPFEIGATDGAVYSNTSTSVDHVFFGARNTPSTSLPFGLYHYNSSTNSITSESIAINSTNIYYGTKGMGFFSPSTGHDSLSIFVNINYVNGDSIYIFRKHYNQAGVVTTWAKLPELLYQIDAVFNFNGDMYVAGHTSGGDGKLMKSSDGINFNMITNYETNYPFKYIVDACEINSDLYLGLSWGGSSGYDIIKTPDGTNFTSVINNSGTYGITSLANLNNTLWYSYYIYYGSKSSSPNQNTNSINLNAAYVSYLDPSQSEVLSIDTLGRFFNQGETFKLNILNSKLLLGGNYFDEYNYNSPGNFIYQFVPPVANFSLSSSNLCLNSSYTFSDQSTSADSVRWYVDSDFYVSTLNSVPFTFTTTGSHTIGIIAISGTQKDSLQYVVNVYSVGLNMNPNASGCFNVPIQFTANPVGAINPISYNWTCSAMLNYTSATNPNFVVTTSVAGTYTYGLSITDANGCTANSGALLLTIQPNKDITGSVNVNSVPLTAGQVMLYRYEPILTQFDLIETYTLNSTNTFTFAQANAFTYLIKCEPSSSTLMATYAPSETSWKTATIVTHGCSNNTSRDIDVVPLTVLASGPGVLSGKIVEGINYGGKGTTVPGNPIGGLTIKGGKNPGGGISAQGKTDASGGFTFTNLPYSGPGEHYFILVDVPGLDTNQTYHRAITASSLLHTDLDFVIDSAKITPLNDVNVKEIMVNENIVKIFPNPTSGILNIHMTLDQYQTVSLKLFDISGKEVLEILPSLHYFNNELKIQSNVKNVTPGVYFLKLNIGETERNIRIVIAH